MSQIDTNATLWLNISALMVKHWGDENLNRLARECKIGPGTAARIKEQKTSVGLETLEKIAHHFQLAVWQLLVPGLDPENPPALQPVSAAERRLYEQIMSSAKTIASEIAAKDYSR
jgi:transcriptional regulator with XRE-family HTH domain